MVAGRFDRSRGSHMRLTIARISFAQRQWCIQLNRCERRQDTSSRALVSLSAWTILVTGPPCAELHKYCQSSGCEVCRWQRRFRSKWQHPSSEPQRVPRYEDHCVTCFRFQPQGRLAMDGRHEERNCCSEPWTRRKAGSGSSREHWNSSRGKGKSLHRVSRHRSANVAKYGPKAAILHVQSVAFTINGNKPSLLTRGQRCKVAYVDQRSWWNAKGHYCFNSYIWGHPTRVQSCTRRRIDTGNT